METSAPGGINKTVREIAKNLSKCNHEVTVLQANPLDLPEEEFYEGFKIIRVSSKFEKHFYGLSPAMYSYLKKHLKDINPDVVHVHGYHTLLSVEVITIIKNLKSKLNLNFPIVFSPHLDVVNSTFAGKHLWKFYNLIGKYAFKKSSKIISFSKFETSKIISTFFMDNSKLSLIPHGVDLININKNKTQDGINLVYSGYLINRKGVDFILKSLNSLIYDFNVKDVSLTIIGEGPERKKLLNLSKELNLEEYIIWKPFLSREDLINEIKKADIFMLLSRSEAYGITVAESLALGTPCIVTKRTALTEFLNEPGCFGVNYPPNPKEVADLIIKIYESDIHVGSFSKKIRTWDKVAEDYERVYSSL
ncbi:glycosyltransferase family 4 protein [Methanobacterium congolense]|nr:glycosyltransferase family 4 protein [Methanobacterium congolense]